jgi:hypothetical protein
MGPRAGLDVVAKREVCLCPEQTSGEYIRLFMSTVFVISIIPIRRSTY